MEQSIRFILQPFYASNNAAELIQSKRPESLNQPRDRSKANTDRTFISSLVSAPTLTLDEERYWFDWMNFLKYRAEKNRLSLDLSRLDPCCLRKIEEDLAEALRIRNHIVESNLRLVVAIAKQHSRLPGQIYDLISEAMPPLIRAVELFDVGSGNHFSTYATWSVRNEIQRFLKRRKLSSVWFPDEKPCSFENIPDKRIDRPNDHLEKREDAQAIHRVLGSLSDRERRVIIARFGLDGETQRLSLAAIGAQVDLSGERVRQLIESALSKLRIEIQPEDHFFIDGP